MQARFHLATSRYQAKQEILASGLAPVRITLGRPRFDLGYSLAGECRVLAPTPREFRLHGTDFETAYLERLERHGAWLIAQDLCDLHARCGRRGLVLLCFENVALGEVCHRRIFAQWFQERTGWAVPELEVDE